jgi:hypothetical protein
MSATDERFEQLVKERFDALVERFPMLGSYLGLHEHDGELGDATRDAQLQDAQDTRRFIAALKPWTSPNYRKTTGSSANWPCTRSAWRYLTMKFTGRGNARTSGTDDIGDGIFVLFARTARPFSERFEGMAARLEAAPRVLQEQRSRLGDHPQRLWNELELDAAQSLPGLFGEVISAAKAEFGESSAEVRRVGSSLQTRVGSVGGLRGLAARPARTGRRRIRPGQRQVRRAGPAARVRWSADG